MTPRSAVFGLACCSLAVAMNVAAFVLNVAALPEAPVLHSLLATLQAGAAVLMAVLARGHWRRLVEHRRGARMNVRIVRGDVVLRCRLCYGGLGPDGLDTWLIVDPDVLPTDRLQVGMLPPRTAIVWTCP